MVDYIELAALRGSGWQIQELADYYGVHRSTVGRWLGEIGLGTDMGPRELCAKGLHPMDDAVRATGGGRGCRQCKQKRDREYQARRRSKAQA